jgi:hypothetical protein
MARTIQEIKDELDRIFPRDWSDNVIGNAIVTGIATVLAGRESGFDTSGGWFDQMFVGTADDPYLDEHGKDFGVERLPGETDDEYRVRIKWTPKILTEGNAVERLSLPLPGSDYSVIVEEPYHNVLGDSFFLGDTSSLLTDGRELEEPEFLFWIFIPIPEVEFLLADSFLGADMYLGIESYLDETINDLNRRHIREIINIAEQNRAYGIAWGVTIADLVQMPYFAHLFPMSHGGYI